LAGQVALRRPKLGEIEAKIAMPGDARSAGQLEIFERTVRMVAAASEICAPRARLRACSMSRPHWQSSPLTQLCYGRRSIPRLACDRGRRHPVVETALKRDGQPFIATPATSRRARHRSPAKVWLITGPQHGRQIDLLRLERADRAAGADRQLRAGVAARIGIVDRAVLAVFGRAERSWRADVRPSWWRWWKPP